MIGYLRGTLVRIHRRDKRVSITLDVGGIGYEVQVVPRALDELVPAGEASDGPVRIFTHLQLREDALLLYGFASAAERDLFRQLIGVSKIGAQLALALLDTLALPELVGAIVGGNVEVLAQTPGVGKKTAERIALELRSQLKQWRVEADTVQTAAFSSAAREEIELSLLALGYTAEEVMQALGAIAADTNVPADDAEAAIVAAIAWLSRESSG